MKEEIGACNRASVHESAGNPGKPETSFYARLQSFLEILIEKLVTPPECSDIYRE